MLHGRLRPQAAKATTAAAAMVVAALLLVVFATGACSDDDGSGSDTTAPPASTSTTVPVVAPTTIAGTTVPPATVPTTVGTGEVTIRGTVLTLFASARVLQIDPPVDGYSRVALTDETEYRTAGGAPASLQDVEEGSTVEVSGEPGAPGTLIARLVVTG